MQIDDSLWQDCHGLPCWAPWSVDSTTSGRWKYFPAHLLAPEECPRKHAWLPLDEAGDMCLVEWDDGTSKLNILPRELILSRFDSDGPEPALPRPSLEKREEIMKRGYQEHWLEPIDVPDEARVHAACVAQEGS